MDEHLLFRYLTENITEKEKEEVEKWSSLSAENKEILEQFYYVLQLSDRLNAMNTANKEKALLNLKKRIDRQNKISNRRFIIKTLQRVAAILFLPLLMLSGWLLYDMESVPPVSNVEIHSNYGMIASVELPDGSKVWLNGGSYLSYPAIFSGDTREISLVGQGYFEVAHNPDKPFRVKVDEDFSVEVLGTSFNLCAYANEDIIETTLVEGSVALNLLHNNKITRHLIKPNDKAVYSKDMQTMNISVVDPIYDIAWKDQRILFKNHSMEFVVRTLERHYNVDFEIKDFKVMESAITGNFENERLEQIMEYLKIASCIKYNITQETTTGDGAKNGKTIEIWK